MQPELDPHELASLIAGIVAEAVEPLEREIASLKTKQQPTLSAEEIEAWRSFCSNRNKNDNDVLEIGLDVEPLRELIDKKIGEL